MMRHAIRWGAIASVCLPAWLGAQSVLLQLRPRVGDTLVMHLIQESEMSGRRADGAVTPASAVTTLQVFSRAIVESSTESATNLLAITDSVLATTSDPHRPGTGASQRLRGQQMRVRLAPDGAPALAEDGRTAKSVSDAMAMIPATFPRTAVAVGETWVRDVPLPGGATPFGAVLAGRLRAVFRLDSLTRGGTLAWVSMKGDLHPGEAERITGGTRLESGTVTGVMVVDRTRGWLAESQFAIQAQSSVVMSALGAPMRFTMKITQRLRTLKR